MKIAIFHPDLGVGGAERLIVDTALELQERGHHVTLFTSHHSASHCFEETKDGQLEVKSNYDVLLVDQISASLPILKILGLPVFFYCHFPDKLLSKPGGSLKRLYRAPMDALEEWTLGFADEIFVNSQFTACVFEKSFPTLFGRRAKAPQVLYPGIILRNYEAAPVAATEAEGYFSATERHAIQSLKGKRILLSLNRFERKKCIELALTGLDAAQQPSSAKAKEMQSAVLVVAGGYDPRVTENVAYLSELTDLATRLGLSHTTVWSTRVSSLHSDNEDDILHAQVLFMPSISSKLRNHLLHSAEVLIYTPSHEHFGLVPIEAMACGSIVVAMNSGGPTESILHGKTGYLVEPSAKELGLTLRSILKKKQNDASLIAMKERAKERVSSLFTMETFVDQLETRFRLYLQHSIDSCTEKCQ